jgi:hypothetical protein
MKGQSITHISITYMSIYTSPHWLHAHRHLSLPRSLHTPNSSGETLREEEYRRPTFIGDISFEHTYILLLLIELAEHKWNTNGCGMQTYNTHITVYRRRALNNIFKGFTLNVIVKSAPLSRRKEVASGCCAHVKCKAVIPSCVWIIKCILFRLKHTYKHAYLNT